MMTGVDKLLDIIQEIAKGNYSNDIMELTNEDQPETVRTIAEAMAMMMVKVEAREYRLEMLVEELRLLNEKIKQNIINVVSAMASALAARDSYTEGHTARVGDLAFKIACQLGLEQDESELIRIGGILHDIGKIGFSDKLFESHGKKNPPEIVREIIKHPAVGANILHDLDFLGPALEYIHCHHERPDGDGYPRKLKDSDIPLGAKILAVADGYDAMTTDRPYQKGMTPDVAIGILRKHAGKKWDEKCVAALAVVLGSEQF
ncbi:MAG TPA: HD domain-containing protein [Desulfobacteraceae bacterium]|nr:HD domain-containing protein [Desulfobacteraceae bacterium]